MAKGTVTSSMHARRVYVGIVTVVYLTLDFLSPFFSSWQTWQQDHDCLVETPETFRRAMINLAQRKHGGPSQASSDSGPWSAWWGGVHSGRQDGATRVGAEANKIASLSKYNIAEERGPGNKKWWEMCPFVAPHLTEHEWWPDFFRGSPSDGTQRLHLFEAFCWT
jgi:hypothetical protein